MKQQNKNKLRRFKLFEWISFNYYSIDLLIVMFTGHAGNFITQPIWY